MICIGGHNDGKRVSFEHYWFEILGPEIEPGQYATDRYLVEEIGFGDSVAPIKIAVVEGMTIRTAVEHLIEKYPVPKELRTSVDRKPFAPWAFP